MADDPVREERRQHARVPVRVPVYVLLGNEVFQKMVPLETANISRGGLAFETHRELPLEAETLVMVSRLGELPASARIQGRVVYCLRDEARGVYKVGVEFSEFEGVTREQLEEQIGAWVP